MLRRLTITTGARLHFGPLSVRPQRGRHFGGVGLMIDRPRFVARFSPAERDALDAGSAAAQVLEFVRRCRETAPAERRAPQCLIELREQVPEHAGFGSGTQLGLAVARGLTFLGGEVDLAPIELARRVGRAARSAIGTHGFSHGGLIVDAGKRDAADVGALAARVPVPGNWRIVLITPGGAAGLSGQDESAAFDRLPPMHPGTTAELCRLALTELLPALQAGDCDAFGEAVFEYGRLVGDYFAPVQGGVYAHPQMAELVEHLRSHGIRGVGQTSWGPTVFAICPDNSVARNLAEQLSTDPRWRGGRVQLARPLNSGAAVEIEE